MAEEHNRDHWSRKVEFFLSVLGFSLGVGSVWRFPYRVYENGGAVFLIPFAACLVFAAMPMFMMELAFGQYGSSGPISIWDAVPLFRGIGYSMTVIAALSSIYINMLNAYSLYYLFSSFTSKLPWAECKPEWEEYNCVERGESYALQRHEIELHCETLRNESLTSSPEYLINCTVKPQTAAAIYWEKTVLHMSTSIDEGAGDFQWDLCLCLLLAWIIVFVCLIKGIKSSGKVVYFTASFPYVVLTILLAKNCTLEGAKEGIKYYIVPKSLDPLKHTEIWYSAGTQIFYILGIAFGGLETLSSFNSFHNNIYRDAVVVSVVNCCASVFTGFVIFAVLGHMAHVTGLDISEVAAYGPGLVYVAYAESLAGMSVAPLWSILFYLMLLTVGLNSQLVLMETVITAFVDNYHLGDYRFGKVTTTGVSCVVLFLAGLPQCTKVGIYVVTLFDWYSAGTTLFVVAAMEVIVISWIYGVRRFSEDIMLMVGNPCGCFKFWLYVYWWPCWLVITPGLLIFLLAYSGVNYTPVSFSGKMYPAWADGVGWGMVGLVVVFIPLIALVEYCRAHDFKATMRKLLHPKPGWGHRETKPVENGSANTEGSVIIHL